MTKYDLINIYEEKLIFFFISVTVVTAEFQQGAWLQDGQNVHTWQIWKVGFFLHQG